MDLEEKIDEILERLTRLEVNVENMDKKLCAITEVSVKGNKRNSGLGIVAWLLTLFR